MRQQLSLDIGGRRWTLVCTASDDFLLPIEQAYPQLVLAVGLLLSLLLFALSRAQIQQRLRAERMAESMSRSVLSTRDHLASILEAVPDMLLEIDAEGRITEVRSARQAPFEIRPPALVGQHYAQVLPPAAAEVIAAGLQAARLHGSDYEPAICLAQAGGDYSSGLDRLPGSGATPEQPYYVLLSRDVSEQVRLERELRQQRERLNTILDSVEAYIYIKGTDYRYQYANRRTCALFKRSLKADHRPPGCRLLRAGGRGAGAPGRPPRDRAGRAGGGRGLQCLAGRLELDRPDDQDPAARRGRAGLCAVRHLDRCLAARAGAGRA